MWWNHNYKCKSETSCYTECSTDAELMPDPFGIVGEITLYWMFNWWAETCSVGHSYQLGLQSPLQLSPAGFGALLLINYTLSSTSWSSAFTTVSYYCCTFSEQWWEEEACFPWPSSCVVGCIWGCWADAPLVYMLACVRQGDLSQYAPWDVTLFGPCDMTLCGLGMYRWQKSVW